MRSRNFNILSILLLVISNYNFLLSQNSESDSVTVFDTLKYEPTNFTTYSIRDRFSDPYSSLFSNNAYNISSSLINLTSSYDTAGVFYVND